MTIYSKFHLIFFHHYYKGTQICFSHSYPEKVDSGGKRNQREKREEKRKKRNEEKKRNNGQLKKSRAR